MTKNEIIQAAKDRLAEIESEAAALRAMLTAAGALPSPVSPWMGLGPLPMMPPTLPPISEPYTPPSHPWDGGAILTLGSHTFAFGTLDLVNHNGGGVRLDAEQQRYGAS